MLKIRTGYWIAIALCCISETAFSAVTITTVALPGGSSAVGSFTMASCYGQATMLTRSTADNFIESPGYLCIESGDLGIPGDLNGDRHVNGIDLAIILGSWGPCASTNCAADINGDLIINGVDLAIVLSSWG